MYIVSSSIRGELGEFVYLEDAEEFEESVICIDDDECIAIFNESEEEYND